MKNFQELLVTMRKSRGFTQDALASAIGVSRSTIGMYESGKRQPDNEMLELFADFFNVPISTFFDEGTNTQSMFQGLSPEALRIAHAYERLDPYSQATVRAVLDAEAKRPRDDYAIYKAKQDSILAKLDEQYAKSRNDEDAIS